MCHIIEFDGAYVNEPHLSQVSCSITGNQLMATIRQGTNRNDTGRLIAVCEQPVRERKEMRHERSIQQKKKMLKLRVLNLG